MTSCLQILSCSYSVMFSLVSVASRSPAWLSGISMHCTLRWEEHVSDCRDSSSLVFIYRLPDNSSSFCSSSTKSISSSSRFRSVARSCVPLTLPLSHWPLLPQPHPTTGHMSNLVGFLYGILSDRHYTGTLLSSFIFLSVSFLLSLSLHSSVTSVLQSSFTLHDNWPSVIGRGKDGGE